LSQIEYSLPPPQSTSIFVALTKTSTRKDKTDVVEIRNQLREMDLLRKEKGKEKIFEESSTSTKEKLDQMILSNMLESFRKDLSNQEEKRLDPTVLKDKVRPPPAPILPINLDLDLNSVSFSSSSSFSITAVESFPIIPATSSIFMTDHPDQEVDSNPSKPKVIQSNNPSQNPTSSFKQFFLLMMIFLI